MLVTFKSETPLLSPSTNRGTLLKFIDFIKCVCTNPRCAYATDHNCGSCRNPRTNKAIPCCPGCHNKNPNVKIFHGLIARPYPEKASYEAVRRQFLAVSEGVQQLHMLVGPEDALLRRELESVQKLLFHTYQNVKQVKTNLWGQFYPSGGAATGVLSEEALAEPEPCSHIILRQRSSPGGASEVPPGEPKLTMAQRFIIALCTSIKDARVGEGNEKFARVQGDEQVYLENHYGELNKTEPPLTWLDVLRSHMCSFTNPDSLLTLFRKGFCEDIKNWLIYAKEQRLPEFSTIAPYLRSVQVPGSEVPIFLDHNQGKSNG